MIYTWMVTLTIRHFIRVRKRMAGGWIMVVGLP
jgi:hypothetical protein